MLTRMRFGARLSMEDKIMTLHRAITYSQLAAASEEFQREMCDGECSHDRAKILARGVTECLLLQRALMDLQDDEIETQRLKREHAEFMEQDQQEEWESANVPF